VLRVRDTLDPLKTEYALKRLRDAARYGRFLNEIEALRGIDHPNVIKIADHSGEGPPGDTKHKYWFVIPLASGSLEQRVGLYKGDFDAVLRVAIQLADALAAAHAKDIVHRDVKPPNILFPRLDHEVWLADFGICHLGTAKERLTRDSEIVGPRAFIAPELEVGGQVPVSGAADGFCWKLLKQRRSEYVQTLP
jgi:serine/threonine protein kinase